jgi:hypothetical protein
MKIISLAVSIAALALALAACAHAHVPGLAPFVGNWAGLREDITIGADGHGRYHHKDRCPSCRSMSEFPYSYMDFTLTSVSGNTASGTIIGDTVEHGYTDEPITITLEPPGKVGPRMINVMLNGKQGPGMCPSSDARWCGD